MSISVNLPETPEQLAALIDRIQAGEELLLIKEGIAVPSELRKALIARLVPTHPRIPGQDKGRVTIASDFNAPLPEDILNDFVNPA